MTGMDARDTDLKKELDATLQARRELGEEYESGGGGGGARGGAPPGPRPAGGRGGRPGRAPPRKGGPAAP
ncbi:hypothetical protein ACFW88_05385, partial [Streptomyces anandii]